MDKDLSRNAILLYGFGDGGGGPARDYLEYAKREADLEGCPKVKLEGPSSLPGYGSRRRTEAYLYRRAVFQRSPRNLYFSGNGEEQQQKM